MEFQLIFDNDVTRSDVGILDSVVRAELFHWRTYRVCNAFNFRPGQRWQIFAEGHGDEYKGTMTVAKVNVQEHHVTFTKFLPRPIHFPIQFLFPGDLLVLIPKGLE